MADWSLIRSTLKTWIEAITGLDAHWKRRPAGWFGTGANPDQGYLILYITGRKTIGNDQIIEEYDATQPTAERIRTYQVGQRQFTFTVQARTWIEDDDYDAMTYTDKVRDSVGLPVVTGDALDVANIAFARILADNDFEFEEDGRDISASQIDLLMNAASVKEDTKGPWIETVKDARLEIPEGTLRWTGDLEVG